METKVGPLCSQDWKIQQKEVSRHYLRWCQAKYAIFLLPLFIVPPIYTIIHAWHYIRERYRIICTYDVHRVPYTGMIRTIFEYIQVLCCFGHRCLPWSLVSEINVGKIKGPQSGTITFGLKSLYWRQSLHVIVFTAEWPREPSRKMR